MPLHIVSSRCPHVAVCMYIGATNTECECSSVCFKGSFIYVLVTDLVACYHNQGWGDYSNITPNRFLWSKYIEVHKFWLQQYIWIKFPSMLPDYFPMATPTCISLGELRVCVSPTFGIIQPSIWCHKYFLPIWCI